MPTLLHNTNLITVDGIITNGWLLIGDNEIDDIGSGEPPGYYEECMKYDLKGDYLGPGLIDIHCHGGAGADVMDAVDGIEPLVKISEYKAKHGVTGWLATPLTASAEKIQAVCREIQQGITSGQAFNLLGAHIEGPYISEAKKGAQNSKYIREAVWTEVDSWLEILGHNLRIISLAPEKLEADTLIKKLLNKGILPAAAHTDADYDTMKAAITKGIGHASHFFNGMRGLHHRRPGTVGAFLDSSQTSLELIADGIHIHPAAIRLVIRAAGKERIVLVTDAMRAAGMPDGHYELGGLEVNIKEGEARLKDGSLAGSTLTLFKAVEFIFNNTDLALYQAWQLASYNPARVLGLSPIVGTLKPGAQADLVSFSKSFEVESVWLAGEKI
ncbi:MAG: N-acetylglucosamine-6-phosphate deacetylase [Bacillota bacterium]